MSNSGSNVLDRILDPLADCLTPEVAKKIADLRADVQTQARFDELADKANEGQLRMRNAQSTTSSARRSTS